MPNIAKIYSIATGKAVAPEQQPEDKDLAIKTQVRLNWLQSTPTQEMFSSIGKEIEDCLAQAETLAVTYSTHQNHQQIIQILVKANTLRKVLESYASNH